MKNKVFLGLGAALAVAFAGNVMAATVVTPNDLAGPGTWGTTDPYGWDWDQGAPLGSDTVGGAPGYDDSSWYSDVQGSTAGGPRNYTTLRINVQGMFGQIPVTMGDLDEISYWTYLVTDAYPVDWQLKIYTMDTTPAGTWYDHRFNFDRPTFAAGAWNQSSTDTNLNVDWIAGLGGNQFPASYSLADASTDYASEHIMFIDIIAGFSTSSPPVQSYLDGVAITVNGVTRDLNLEANAVVPVPAAAPLGLLGMGLVALIRRRKNAKA